MAAAAAVRSASLLDQHLAWMDAAGRGLLTIRARRATVASLSTATRGDPGRMSREELEAWAAVRRPQMTSSTWRKELSHVRAWFAWCVLAGARADNPGHFLPMPKPKRAVPRPLSDVRLREALTRADVEDRAVLLLARLAGLRACEVAQLTWSDVDLAEAVLFVRKGKGGHQREVSMPAALVDVLRAMPRRGVWVVTRRDGGPGPNEPSVVSKRASAVLGGRGAGGTLHQLRHSFGTSVYQVCLDIRTTQILMGHASPTTTAMYAGVRTDAVRSAVEAAGRALDMP
jgi:integrase